MCNAIIIIYEVYMHKTMLMINDCIIKLKCEDLLIPLALGVKLYNNYTIFYCVRYSSRRHGRNDRISSS